MISEWLLVVLDPIESFRQSPTCPPPVGSDQLQAIDRGWELNPLVLTKHETANETIELRVESPPDSTMVNAHWVKFWIKPLTSPPRGGPEQNSRSRLKTLSQPKT